MTVYRDPAMRADAIADLTQLCRQLVNAHRKLEDAFHDEDEGRGYPSGHGGPSSGTSDRTYNAAISETAHKARLNSARRQFDAETNKARKAICSALGAVQSVTQPPVKPKDAKEVGDLSAWCENCLKASKNDHHEPRHQSEKHCSWCSKFKRDHGVLPPKGLLEKHWRGDRISERDIVQAGIRVAVTS